MRHAWALAPWLEPHLVAVTLCVARLVPISFLCPLLGGQAAPATVRLALSLGLALSVHFAGGVSAPELSHGAWALAGAVLRELCLGSAIGLIAALPFDAARIGGRFIDLFRGASAEAALPAAGTRESATGDGLYQLVVALAVSSGVFPLVLSGIWRSFGVVRLGAVVPSEAGVLQVASLAGGAVATGLAIGAPVAGAALAVDWTVGLLSRAAPQARLQELGGPLRILGGAALVWLALGLISERLLASVAASHGDLRSWLQASP